MNIAAGVADVPVTVLRLEEALDQGGATDETVGRSGSAHYRTYTGRHEARGTEGVGVVRVTGSGAMRVPLSTAELRLRHRGPVCLSSSNRQRFCLARPDGEELVDVNEIPDAEIGIVAYGRRRSRNSIVVGDVH